MNDKKNSVKELRKYFKYLPWNLWLADSLLIYESYFDDSQELCQLDNRYTRIKADLIGMKTVLRKEHEVIK